MSRFRGPGGGRLRLTAGRMNDVACCCGEADFCEGGIDYDELTSVSAVLDFVAISGSFCSPATATATATFSKPDNCGHTLHWGGELSEIICPQVAGGGIKQLNLIIHCGPSGSLGGIAADEFGVSCDLETSCSFGVGIAWGIFTKPFTPGVYVLEETSWAGFVDSSISLTIT